ncbi:MAG: VCBS repeat-containing protein [Planctomycetota bacterium]|nr:MAG: VCBS repeat-containing protein [Planctomycetota bacterium]
MQEDDRKRIICAGIVTPVLIAFTALPAAGLNFGSEEIVKAGGINIDVPGYSVPSYEDWNNDGKNDLIIGQGTGAGNAAVRVYLNTSTTSNPQFNNYVFAQSLGSNLTCPTPGSGCLGCFPRLYPVTPGNPPKTLIVGHVDGTIKSYTNNGIGDNPPFDGGSYLQVGNPSSAKINIDVGNRATPSYVDWNNDGKRDLVVGAYDGKIRIYLNHSTGPVPDFHDVMFAKANGLDLVVPSIRSSPVVIDMDGDGAKDILAGNTNGQILFYSNTGTDAAPSFGSYEYVQSNGVNIDLLATRSRPFVCDWTGDGLLDLLVGASDGNVRLYQGVPEPATFLLFIVGGLAIIKRRP